MNAATVCQLLLSVADSLIASKSYLTDVDSSIGDGDHGIGMALGMENAKHALAELDGETNCYVPFSKMGQAMLMSMGGASGVIFGTMFMGGAKGKQPAEDLTTAAFAQLMEDSLNMVKKRGGAQVGDKTMIDAFEPAVLAMKQCANPSFCSMFDAAQQAAEAGMLATKEMIAKFGRAKSLMERAVGHQDAGATSVYLIFHAMHTFVVERGDLI